MNSTSSVEENRRSQTGSEKHMAPFKRRELEKVTGADQKPSSDNLFDLRHTREYEEIIEKKNVGKYISINRLSSISQPFIEKVSRNTFVRSNSDEHLLPKVPKVDGKKRRHSINKKLQKSETGNLMNTDFTIKGSDLNFVTGSVPCTSDVLKGKITVSKLNLETDEASSDFSESSPEKDRLFERAKEDVGIEIEEFSPKENIRGVRKVNFHEESKTPIKEPQNPDCQIINNEMRNLKLEKELERPHRPSSVMKYRKQITNEGLPIVSSKDEEVKEDIKEELIEDSPKLENSDGPELLIDPDEDPELAALIDAELAGSSCVPCPESEKPSPPYLPAPPKGKEYTLVLDLDETLIHYRDDEEYYLVRPGVNRFLQELSQLYDVVLFTAGVKKYADWIVDHIDPQRYIAHRLYRRHTVFKDAMYIKDLSMLGRDLRKTLIIDNLYESFLSQPDNGILVKSWYDDMDDTELLTLLPFLRGLVEDRVPDVREVLKRIMNSNSDEGEGEGDAEGEEAEDESESPNLKTEAPHGQNLLAVNN